MASTELIRAAKKRKTEQSTTAKKTTVKKKRRKIVPFEPNQVTDEVLDSVNELSRQLTQFTSIRL